MTLWAIHPHPRNDEVLSSWITRIAHENQMKISTFCKVALNANPRHLIDIDYREGEDIIQTLSEGTGIEIDRIRGTSLLSEYRYVFGDFHSIPISWVVPTKYKRQALSPGLNFCPQCLDEEPYFRKSWRFAFYPVCTSHSIVLRQFCPQCQKPFQYIDSSHLAFGTSTITICKYCGFDIRHSPAEANAKSINECTIALQKMLHEGINFDSFAIPGHGHVRALEYLSELRRTMSLCSHSKYADWIIQRYRHEIPQEIDIATSMITQNYRRLEERSPMELNVIMALASIIMKDWPARCEEFDLAHNFSVMRQGKKLPTPYGFDNLKDGKNIRDVRLDASLEGDADWLFFEALDVVVEVQQNHVIAFEQGLETQHAAILPAGEGTGNHQIIFGNLPDGHGMLRARLLTWIKY